MDKRIDSHKLMFHPERVAGWLRKEQLFPINMEICLTGACNHRCTFCCCDYMGYKPDTLDYDLLLQNIEEISKPENGLKSILLAGTGEPCLYPRFTDMVNGIKKLGVDVALSTNGVLFTPDKIEAVMPSLSWIRFSTSGGTENTYHKIHRGKPGDLQRVFDNIEYAAQYKKKNRLKTVINVQIVMVPDNVSEIVEFGKRVKELGADNYIVKAFGANPKMENRVGENIGENFFTNCEDMIDSLEKLNGDGFDAVYREERIHNLRSTKDYTECFASPFHAFMAANGSVYPCCHLPGMRKYEFGNINNGESLMDIFMDRKGRRREVLKELKEQKLAPCPMACKLELPNKYLNGLVHPDDHVNFI